MNGFNAITVRSHIDASSWNRLLMTHGGFPQPYARGAILECISAGIEEVQRRYAPASHQRPPIAVPLDAVTGEMASFEGSLAYSHRNKIILATRSWLNNMNGLPLDRAVSITGGSAREICHTGMLSHVCTLMGAEEADHALYRQEHPDTTERVSTERAAGLTQYDTIPIEFRALERQLEIARTLRMPDVTVRVLEQRIKNVMEYRKTLG